MRKFSPVLGSETTSMQPRGNLGSRRTLLSTLILPDLSLQILMHSWPERAYFSLLRRSTDTGMHSRSLCGPGEGLVAYTPDSLSRHQWEGAHMRFICFFGPLAYTHNCTTVKTQAKRKQPGRQTRHPRSFSRRRNDTYHFEIDI